MSMNLYPFSKYDLRQIAKLPSDISALAEKYPCEIINVADAIDDDPFPDGYIPHIFEIYYGTSDNANIYIVDGVLQDYNVPEFDGNTPSVSILFDGNFAYIEVEGKELLNKLGGAVLPHVTINPSTLIEILTRGVSHD
ncbi:hypothetical protein H6G94_32705 [Nostoc punctiforme FACHB-252]|uniref:Uncharacterized protein n=1 Tax=Nostoc punctiforme FACHB-252 TaxID=1357509 RepID=A0ABR8HKA3_NOSPU|nr:hypothetical protein [Nostoc punctiforme]MBD2615953.1 hypothetical protein [Nostoc punctiforme FACHB-252]